MRSGRELEDIQSEGEEPQKDVMRQFMEIVKNFIKVLLPHIDPKPGHEGPSGKPESLNDHAGTYDSDIEAEALVSPNCLALPSSDVLLCAGDTNILQNFIEHPKTLDSQLEYFHEIDLGGLIFVSAFVDMELQGLYEVVLHLEAVPKSETGNPEARLLGYIYYFIFLQTGVVEDLDKAIDMNRIAITGADAKAPNYFPCWKNIVVMLLKKYSCTDSPSDLMAAKSALEAILQDRDVEFAVLEEQRTLFMCQLEVIFDVVNRCMQNFKESNNADLQLAISAIEAALLSSSRVVTRITAAIHASYLFTIGSELDEAVRFAELSAKLFPLMPSRQLDQREQLHVRKLSWVASCSASFTLFGGGGEYNAIRVLELGRGAITGLRLEMRPDLTELKLHHPDMAAQFEKFREILDSPLSISTDSTFADDDQTSSVDENRLQELRHCTNIELNKLIDQIRFLPNFDTVLDRVISSYCSSIKSLLYSRQNDWQPSPEPGLVKSLLIAVDDTPGHSSLNTRLDQPCRDDVLNSIRECSIFHFAGHGQFDPDDPSQSSLFVKDWAKRPLTAEDLTKLNFKRNSSTPWLAYLPACSTSNNSAEQLYDESLHLVTSFQLAGFRHVVGTLWEVSDEYCVDAAKAIYETILEREIGNDLGVALGVHKASRILRDRAYLRDRQRHAAFEEEEEEVRGKEKGRAQEDLRRVRHLSYREPDKTEINSPLIWAAYVHVGA
ncbi:hypothetical protein TWF703_009099 [Orbilia oligospora]|uniref:CHAT domain-containing protein n=1 Tax=Orbilia oligospora TaxID=2813651 RepID=A0A7C8JK68_ORBOL|nr:hypothetical protein TWF703_009099 [Orbilia oligospora]